MMETRSENNNFFEGKLIDLQVSMMNFALNLTSNKEEAKDLLQETTLRVLDNKEKYYENINFKGWVFTIMRNVFVNNYHRIVRIRNQTMIDQTEILCQLNKFQNYGSHTPENDFVTTEISNVINSVSDEYRIPFSMYVSGYKYEEIAQRFKMPIGTVKSRIFFARKRLQKLLADYKYQ